MTAVGCCGGVAGARKDTSTLPCPRGASSAPFCSLTPSVCPGLGDPQTTGPAPWPSSRLCGSPGVPPRPPSTLSQAPRETRGLAWAQGLEGRDLWEQPPSPSPAHQHRGPRAEPSAPAAAPQPSLLEAKPPDGDPGTASCTPAAGPSPPSERSPGTGAPVQPRGERSRGRGGCSEASSHHQPAFPWAANRPPGVVPHPCCRSRHALGCAVPPTQLARHHLISTAPPATWVRKEL